MTGNVMKLMNEVVAMMIMMAMVTNTHHRCRKLLKHSP